VIRLFDSIAGEVRDLETRDPGRLSMYVCGPTVYDLPHLGHGRYFLVWDVARRWFSFRGYDVRFVSNVTDIDDNIINRATAETRQESAVANAIELAHFAAMDELSIMRPDVVPHATHYVDAMIDFIGSLIEAGVAYATSDGVYFDVSSVPDYGILAGQPLDSLRAGARVETVEGKKSPLDFVLWKAAKPGQPSWEAPYGAGRPGWHTECVVMSLALLGDNFDLHVGGFDLRFPHHENERAQAVASHHLFARHWSHSGWVMAGDQKMSKSLHNFTSLTDLTQSTDPRAYRLLVLRSHYRSPIDVTPETIGDAVRSLERLDALARRFRLPTFASSTFVRESDYNFGAEASQLVGEVAQLLDNDLETPSALARIFEAVSRANSIADEGEEKRASELALAVAVLLGGLGLALQSTPSDDIDEATLALVAARDDARRARDFDEADRLRRVLEDSGWVVEDSAGSTQIRR